MINDGCHGLGAKINNSTGYAIKYADFVTYSFHPVKSITTEESAIITNNKSIDIRIKKLRSHGITRNTQKYLWHNDMQQLGYNYRITDFQCALGSSQLRKLDKFVKSRKSIALFYDKNFKILITLSTQIFSNFDSAYHLYPLKIDFKSKD